MACYTYVCDQTLEPQWLQQRFAFDVPQAAQSEYRHYSLRILVKAKSLTGVDNVLSILDVPLSCLRDEKEIEGWFPLRPSRSSLLVRPTCGSIKLRVQWVHSPLGLTNFILTQSRKRLRELQLQLHVQNFFLKSVQRQVTNKTVSTSNLLDADVADLRQKDYYSLIARLSPKDDQPLFSAQLQNASVSIPISEDRLRRTGGDFSDVEQDSRSLSRIIFALEDDDDVIDSFVGGREPDKGAKTGEERRYPDVMDTSANPSDPICHPKYHYHRIYRTWLSTMSTLRSLHSKLARFMGRPPSVQSLNADFRCQFVREGWRNFTHAFTQTGVLEIA
ncbi:hypothetical protein EON65_18015, partial [archaeon]